MNFSTGCEWSARVRDFKGVDEVVRRPRELHTGFARPADFPEIDYAKVDKQKGMNVTIMTTAGSRPIARPAPPSGHAVPGVGIERLNHYI